MNYDDYKPVLSKPHPSHYTLRTWIKNGKVVAKKFGNQPVQFADGEEIPLMKCKQADELDEAKYTEAKKRFASEKVELELRFKEDFFRELGIEDNPKRELLFKKAYEMGHSAGYEEVMTVGEDLVDLIK